MYFPRTIDAELRAWARSSPRKPLVVRGARQTGKTAAIRELGRHFDLLLELNLERFEDRRLAAGCRSAEELLQAVQVRANLQRLPPRTLLFIDEIQASPEAVGWLRFLHEDHPELAVVAAGSLLEVRLQDRGFSFPVGRVSFRYLHPLSFLESLRALGRDVLAGVLEEAIVGLRPLSPPVHAEALELLRDYLLVGGMPEAVGRWATERSAVAVRQVHGDLVQAFAEDLAKYGGAGESGHLEAAFAHLRHHYGLRFKYESFAPGHRGEAMKTALARLEGAMVIRRAWPTSSTGLPLQTRARAAAKLLPLDVGLALASMGTPLSELQTLPLDTLLDGRVAEMLVGQQLVAANLRTDEPLHFWVTESASGNAELDYLVAASDGIRPVEVKAGASGSLKSLHQFLQRSGARTGYRLFAGELADERHVVRMPEGELVLRLVSLPLYAAELVSRVGVGG